LSELKDKSGIKNTTEPSATQPESNLKKMESLLRHSTLGVHILFENDQIADCLKRTSGNEDFFDFEKMKKVQECMTELIGKNSIGDKMDYIQNLDKESREMLIRSYFHIVENTIRATTANH
jgi:hypothetical protein